MPGSAGTLEKARTPEKAGRSAAAGTPETAGAKARARTPTTPGMPARAERERLATVGTSGTPAIAGLQATRVTSSRSDASNKQQQG